METKDNPAVASIARQYEHTISLLRRSIECFGASEWFSGISSFEVPAKVAYHALQCLLYYFREDPKKTYRQIPPRFGKEWWELDDESLPDQSQVMAFLEEVDGLVREYLSGLSDADLGTTFSGDETIMENLVYAIRHTMHHQGALNLLSIHHGIDADLWE